MGRGRSRGSEQVCACLEYSRLSFVFSWDHPPGPLPVRKGEKRDLWGTPPDPCQRLSGGHPQTPAKGLRPLDTCSLALGDTHRPLPEGLRPSGRLLRGVLPQRWLGPSPCPLPVQEGGKLELWGTPPDPCQRAAPSGHLLTSAGGHPQTSARGAAPSGRLGPSPCPLPSRKGGKLELWGTPPDPCQRAAPWTPAAPLLSLRGVERRGNLGRWGYTLRFSVRASKVPSGSWTNS